MLQREMYWYLRWIVSNWLILDSQGNRHGLFSGLKSKNAGQTTKKMTVSEHITIDN
jgi:hypothetical protein